ncbi:MAG: hypothetical protein IJ958_03120, partial [Agathobacter sp.]|nr:hypothetical protein [Agathobacter sp.]
GIVWTINGKTVTADSIDDIDMTVLVSTADDDYELIPITILNAITGENSYVEVSLVHDGEFGFTAVLSLNLKAENAGMFGNLYYYNQAKQVMEFVVADEIAADGAVEFTFTHASEYAIVIDDKAADDVDDEDDTDPTVPISPDTGDKGGYISYMMLMVVTATIIVASKKKVVRRR